MSLLFATYLNHRGRVGCVEAHSLTAHHTGSVALQVLFCSIMEINQLPREILFTWAGSWWRTATAASQASWHFQIGSFTLLNFLPSAIWQIQKKIITKGKCVLDGICVTNEEGNVFYYTAGLQENEIWPILNDLDYYCVFCFGWITHPWCKSKWVFTKRKM